MTDYLPRKSAKRSLHNHCRGYHRGDPDIQQQQVPADRIAGDVVQRNSEGRTSDPVNKVQDRVTRKRAKDIGPGGAI